MFFFWTAWGYSRHNLSGYSEGYYSNLCLYLNEPMMLTWSLFFCVDLCFLYFVFFFGNSFLFISGCARETKRTKGSDSSLTPILTEYFVWKNPQCKRGKKGTKHHPRYYYTTKRSLFSRYRDASALKKISAFVFHAGAPIFIRIF